MTPPYLQAGYRPIPPRIIQLLDDFGKTGSEDVYSMAADMASRLGISMMRIDMGREVLFSFTGNANGGYIVLLPALVTGKEKEN